VTLFCRTAFACQREPPLYNRIKNRYRVKTPIPILQTRKLSGYAEILLKIGWTPRCPFAFFTFCDIFGFAALKKSLHPDFPTAGTKEFLGSVGCTGVFT
jgi:hypothetical protein